MSQVDESSPSGYGGTPPAPRPGIPCRTIPHFAVPAGATSPIPPALVEAVRTTFTWTRPQRPRYAWQPPEAPATAWTPPAA